MANHEDIGRLTPTAVEIRLLLGCFYSGLGSLIGGCHI